MGTTNIIMKEIYKPYFTLAPMNMAALRKQIIFVISLLLQQPTFENT